jgi:hypothetical protein
LLDGLWCENIVDFENMDNAIHDLYNEELHGEGIYTLDDGVQGSSFDSKSKERSEDDIEKHDEEVWVYNNSKQHEVGNQQVNGCRHDDVEYGDGLRGRNSNVVKRQKSEWRGVECDLVDNGGVFTIKG